MLLKYCWLLIFLFPPIAQSQETDEDKVTILARCAEHVQAGRLITGLSGTAYACYHEILGENPHDADAIAGLKTIEQIYADWAWRALGNKHKINAHKFISRLALVNQQSSLLPDLQAAFQKTFPTASAPVSSPLPNPPLYDKIQGDVGELKIQLKQLKQEFIDIESAVDKKLITETQALELTEVKRRFERLQQEFYTIKDPSQMFYAVIITLWQQLKYTEEKLIEAQAKVGKNSEIETTLSEQVKQLSQQQQIQLTELQQLRTENQSLKQENEQLKQDQSQKQAQLTELQAQKQALETSSEQQRSKYYQSQQALHAEKNHTANLQNRVKELNHSLSVVEANIAKTCDIQRLQACHNESSCIGAGGTWELGECLAQSKCQPNTPQDCRTEQLCLAIKAIWTEHGCQHPQPCNPNLLLKCQNPDSCVKAGGRWVNFCLPSELLH